ncbi:MAG: hypothetical protein JKY37_16075 [Nannocystaceae bacterium]|nr:hypothetical protein [Nannocystaceae bacterium]
MSRPKKLIVSAAARPRIPASESSTKGLSRSTTRVLSLVPELTEGLMAGLYDASVAEPGLRPVDVVMCCAARDLPAMGRIFDALQRHGCVPVAMTGAERDPRRVTESARAAGHPRLYVVCKTPSVDGGQARRLAQAFARAGRRGQHQLLVLDLDLERIYAAVPHIRRGADQLRRRMDESIAGESARTTQMPRATPGRAKVHRAMPADPRREPARPAAVTLDHEARDLAGVATRGINPVVAASRTFATSHRIEPRRSVDTSYAMHRRPDGTGEQHIDRIIVDIDPLPVAQTRARRVSQRAGATGTRRPR